MKTHKKLRSKAIKRIKFNLPLVFAGIFGAIMLAVGLSQIFAQSTVAFVFVPTSQTANAGENRSVAITLYNNNQAIDGGRVAISYDPALLDFVSFGNPTSPGIAVTNNSSASGNYSYDFTNTNPSQTNPNTGTLTLRARSISSNQAAIIRFDGINTKAYNGTSAANRTYYQVAYGQAAISINASSQPATTSTPASTPASSPPVNTSPPTSSTSKPANSAPLPSSSPSVTTARPPTTNSVPSDLPITNPEVSQNPTYANNTFAPMRPRQKKPISPYAFILGGLLLFGAGLFILFKYRTAIIEKLQMGGDVDASTLESDDDVAEFEDENIVVEPTVAHEEVATAVPAAIAVQKHPRIILKHSAKHSKNVHHTPVLPAAAKPPTQPNQEPAPPPSELTASPKAKEVSEQTLTKVIETTDKAHHKQVEVDIVHVKPEQPQPITEAKHVETSPHTEETQKTAAETKPEPPSYPVPVLPQATPKPPLPHTSPPMAQPAKPSHSDAPVLPSIPVPDWQNHLTPSPSHPTDRDDPPDMFELAAQHPETFGSYQALDAENDQNDTTKKAAP